MSETLLIERVGDIIVATIDVPARHNAADLHVYHRLEEALALDAAGYVITGANGDFSAGDDVRMFAFDDLASSDAFLVDVTTIFEVIEAVSRPVVAAVDGYALGFGFELALACDVVIASPRAVFGLPEIRQGAAPPNAMGRGPHVLGRGLTRHLALSGSHWLSGEEAHDQGLVAELHEPELLRPAAIELVGEMVTNPRFVDAKRVQTADAQQTYRMAPVIMAPLMASPTVSASQQRYDHA